jgi:GAF domain-containing protein
MRSAHRRTVIRRSETRSGRDRSYVSKREAAETCNRDTLHGPRRASDRSPQRLADTAGVVVFREAELKERLDELAAVARRVFGVTGAGLMLLDERDGLAVVGVSDQAAGALDRAQQEARAGPGLQSTQTRQIVVVEDLAVDPRWPEISQRIAGFEVHAVLSAPITQDEQAIGNLSLFDSKPRAWTDADLDRARSLVGVVATWLGVVVDAHSSGRRLAQLTRALDFGEPTGPAAQISR